MPKVQELREVTEKMRSFYTKYPFPNYEGDADTLSVLVQKGTGGAYSRSLNEEIPYGARVLDVGCGTGQLPLFLGKGGTRRVVGVDMTFESLRLGQQVKQKYGLREVHFSCMDLFHLGLKEETFDYLFCNGVLHHTADPRGGFRQLCRLVKPKGYLLIGLYNRYARLTVYLKRAFLLMTHSKVFKNPKEESWFKDQYENPWETCHSAEEVLRWFKEEKVAFVNCWPSLSLRQDKGPPKVFQPGETGSLPERLLVQLGWIFSRGSDGGYFLMIGQKSA